MKKVAISIGDLNGIGIQLALENHQTISKEVKAVGVLYNPLKEIGSNVVPTAVLRPNL